MSVERQVSRCRNTGGRISQLDEADGPVHPANVGEGEHVKRSIREFSRRECSRATELRATAIALMLSLPLFVFVFQACSGSGGGTTPEDLSTEPSIAYGLFACSPSHPYPGQY